MHCKAGLSSLKSDVDWVAGWDGRPRPRPTPWSASTLVRKIGVLAELSGCGLLLVLTAAAFSGPDKYDDPWNSEEVLHPLKLVAELKTRDSGRHIIAVGTYSSFKGSHLPNAIFAGPGNKEKGLDLLAESFQKIPHDAEIIIYCGCCPFVRCPNIRPAYKSLKAAGFTNIKVLKLDTNLNTDWVDKGYTIELSTK